MSRQNPYGPLPALSERKAPENNTKEKGSGEIWMKTKNDGEKKKRAGALKEDSIKERQYLAGLKKYRDQGIVIRIDGEELPEKDWGKIFEVREDDCFYMADYISDEKTGKLHEIRFERVYNR